LSLLSGRNLLLPPKNLPALAEKPFNIMSLAAGWLGISREAAAEFAGASMD